MKASTQSSPVIERYVKPAMPIATVVLLLSVFKHDKQPSAFSLTAVFVVSAMILWFGRRWIRRAPLMDWTAILLWYYLEFTVGSFALKATVTIGILFLIASIPFLLFLLYDLLVRQPRIKSFRGRAELL